MQKYALLIFFVEYYEFPETEIFFFLKIKFLPFPMKCSFIWNCK